MSTGCCMEVLNHCIVHLKLIVHCMLTSWNLNKNLEKILKNKIKKKKKKKKSPHAFTPKCSQSTRFDWIEEPWPSHMLLLPYSRR